MSYVDEENDNITIDSKESLQKAITKYRADGARALKVTKGREGGRVSESGGRGERGERGRRGLEPEF
jgi:hypothetical protein